MTPSSDSQPPRAPSSSDDSTGAGFAASAFARSEQDQFRRLFEEAPALIAAVSGPSHVYTYANPRYRTLFGGRDIVGKPIREALPELAGQGYYELLDQVYRTGESFIGEAVPADIDRDDSGRLERAFFHITFQAARGAAGVVDGIFIHAVEVTEHVLAREELERSRARYEALARTRTQFVWGTGPSGLVDDMPEWRAFTGQTQDEVRGLGWSDAVHPVDRETALAAWTSAVAGKTLYEVEYRTVHTGGGYRWLHVRGLPVLEADGAIREWVGVANDITEQKEAQAALIAANETLSAQRAELQAQQKELSSLYEQLRHRHERVQSERDRLFELSLDLVATVDGTGYLSDVNPAWTKTLGWTADELKSRPLLTFVAPEDRTKCEAEVRKLLLEGVPTLQFQARFLTHSGGVRTLDWRAYADQGVIYAIARDVTEQARLQKDRLEALEQSDRLKDQFLGILSHELRTPINAIMGFGSVLDDEVAGPLTPRQRAYTGKILGSADALLALIEDLLIVSRVQAGKFSISPQRIRFEDLVADALESQEPAARKKAISLLADPVAGDLPALTADPMRVVQVLNNLLGNAIKFTPEGGRVVVKTSAEGGFLRCEVADTGVGIAAADQPKLFQRFSQLDMSNTRSAGGAGLGLSIVKAIVNAHGGEVGIHSEPGEGATFWFTLPLEP
jgi:PAS domain S-box-containing protein